VDFVKEYMAARELAFLPSTIAKAWEKCGIYPLNLNIFTDANFAPSASTSRHAHLLGSYPINHDSDNSNFETDSDGSDGDSDDGSDGTESDHSHSSDESQHKLEDKDGEATGNQTDTSGYLLGLTVSSKILV